jgi:amidase
MTPFAEYAQYDGLALAELVRSRAVSPAELVEAAIERIERHNGRLNAVIFKMYDKARALAASGKVPDGPFAGVPLLVKNLLQAVDGEPLTAGTRMMQGFRPSHDSELTRRYRRAGFVLLGKTNTPEFGLLPFTEPDAHGATRNPWNTERTPGGSSGGAAAAVAARFVPIAHGGDGGGSIRIPASCTGLFGMKPTRARTPAGPDASEGWQGLAVEHVLTRSVRDSAAVLDATHGTDLGAPYEVRAPERSFLEEVTREPKKLRIALTTHPFLGTDVHADCKAAVKATGKLLQELGHEVDEAHPTVHKDEIAQAFVLMLACETAADIDEAAASVGKSPHPDGFERATWTLAEVGRRVSGLEYAKAVRTLRMLGRHVAPFFERYDVLVTPTLAAPPVRIGELKPKGYENVLMDALRHAPVTAVLRALLPELAKKAFDWVPYTPLFNVTGQPAMSVPLHMTADGLPVGVQLVGRFGDEAGLFRLAGQLERARPWADRAPPGFG